MLPVNCFAECNHHLTYSHGSLKHDHDTAARFYPSIQTSFNVALTFVHFAALLARMQCELRSTCEPEGAGVSVWVGSHVTPEIWYYNGGMGRDGIVIMIQCHEISEMKTLD